MGTPTREPQDYGRSRVSFHVPIIWLLYLWGAPLEVPYECSLLTDERAPDKEPGKCECPATAEDHGHLLAVKYWSAIRHLS